MATEKPFSNEAATETPLSIEPTTSSDSQPIMDLTLHYRTWLRKSTPWDAIVSHEYEGKGTAESPYSVKWLPSHDDFVDVENPMTYGSKYKWTTTMIAAFSTLSVSLTSSILSAAMPEIIKDYYGYSNEVYILVTTSFLVGFVVGPLLWAPGSEIYGRRATFVFTYWFFVFFNGFCAISQNIWTLIAMRLLAGTFGASTMTNAGGTIADLFAADQRGLAMAAFACAPFLGPAIGPVVGGFLGQYRGWKYVCAFVAIFSGTLCIIGTLFLPETYAPVLLRKRAARLSSATGKVYIAYMDVGRTLTKRQVLMNALLKPWSLLFLEPIVACMAVYLAVVYAILYMQFTAFPIVFEEVRGWQSSIAGLAFIGITIGAFMALGWILWYENPRYSKKMTAQGGYLPPEERLVTVMAGAFLLPLGLLVFAWTGAPASIPWIVCIIATVPFGSGIVFVFLGCSNYLVDSYLMYASSVMAGNTVVRSAFGVVFPLFTTSIYDKLGVNKAGTLIACLGIVFAPCPIIFYIYGRRIRRSTAAARAADDLGLMMAKRTMEARAAATAAATGSVPSAAETAVVPELATAKSDDVEADEKSSPQASAEKMV